jgi:hypothetical protein
MYWKALLVRFSWTSQQHRTFKVFLISPITDWETDVLKIRKSDLTLANCIDATLFLGLGEELIAIHTATETDLKHRGRGILKRSLHITQTCSDF